MAAEFAAAAAPGILSYFGARDQNAASAREAEKMRDHQLYMSNTAHQREVADLRAAGLNPILSVNAGASSGAGAAAPVENTAAGFSGVVTHARELEQLKLQREKQESEIGLLKAQAGKAAVETKVIEKDIPKSEMTNELYEDLKGIWGKVRSGLQTGAKAMTNFIDRDEITKQRQKEEWQKLLKLQNETAKKWKKQ